MQAKRVVAKDMRAALQIIREELGSDTIILSNKKVPEGIELMCSMDSSCLDDSRLEQLRSERATMPKVSKTGAAQPRGGSSQTSQSAPPKVQSLLHAKKQSKTASPISPLAKELEAMQVDAKRKAQQIRAKLQRKAVLEQRHKITAKAASISDVVLPQARAQDFRARIEEVLFSGEDASVENVNEAIVAEGAIESARHTFAENEDVMKLVQSAVSRHMAENSDSVSTINSNKSSDDLVLSTLKSELNAMRELMQMQLGGAAWSAFNDNNPQQALIWRRLNRLGLCSDVTRELLACVDEDLDSENAWFTVLRQLAQRIEIGKYSIVEQGGVHAFVGPTGVGKTTTIGKLAVQHVLKHGNESIALVTLDTHRIAANEQLRTFGRILDVPVKVLNNAEDLSLALHSLRKKSLVLIDTAGLAAGDERLKKQTQALSQLSAKINTHIVLSTTAQQSVIERAYENYKPCGLKSCILSKLDETASLGAALSMVVQKKLPLSYITNGQKIPEDIRAATGNALVAQAVKLARDTKVNEDVMADQFGEAWTDKTVSSSSIAAFSA